MVRKSFRGNSSPYSRPRGVSRCLNTRSTSTPDNRARKGRLGIALFAVKRKVRRSGEAA